MINTRRYDAVNIITNIIDIDPDPQAKLVNYLVDDPIYKQ